MTTVRDIPQLERIVAWRLLFRRPSSVKLELPNIREEDLTKWQSSLNRQLKSACGCTEGSVMLMVAASSYIAYSLLFGEGLGWGAIWLGIGISLTAALVGKFAGIVRAQMQLSTLVRRLKAEA